MVEFYLLKFPRFPLGKEEQKSYFGKNRTHDFRTSRCAGYLLDHSGDEGLQHIYPGDGNSSPLPALSRGREAAAMATQATVFNYVE